MYTLGFFTRIGLVTEHWRHVCGKWVTRTDNTFETCPSYNDGDEDYPDGKEP